MRMIAFSASFTFNLSYEELKRCSGIFTHGSSSADWTILRALIRFNETPMKSAGHSITLQRHVLSSPPTRKKPGFAPSRGLIREVRGIDLGAATPLFR